MFLFTNHSGRQAQYLMLVSLSVGNNDTLSSVLSSLGVWDHGLMRRPVSDWPQSWSWS